MVRLLGLVVVVVMMMIADVEVILLNQVLLDVRPEVLWLDIICNDIENDWRSMICNDIVR